MDIEEKLDEAFRYIAPLGATGNFEMKDLVKRLYGSDEWENQLMCISILNMLDESGYIKGVGITAKGLLFWDNGNGGYLNKKKAAQKEKADQKRDKYITRGVTILAVCVGAILNHILTESKSPAQKDNEQILVIHDTVFLKDPSLPGRIKPSIAPGRTDSIQNK